MNKLFFTLMGFLVLSPNLSYAFPVEGRGFGPDIMCGGSGRKYAVDDALEHATERAKEICNGEFKLISQFIIAVTPLRCKTWEGGFEAILEIEAECTPHE